MNDVDPLLTELRKAGAMVGMSNQQWWLDLVEKHGQDLVMAAVTKLYAATRQPVNAAVTGKACAEVAQRLQDEKDDAAEDAAMGRQVARPTRTAPVAKGAAAAAVREPVVTAAAVTTHPIPESPHAAPAAATTRIPSLGDDSLVSSRAAGEATPEEKAKAAAAPRGLTKQPKPEENDMATVKQLVKSVEDEIKRRGITASLAMREIGVSVSGLVTWRKGTCGAEAQEKIATWLPESAKKPAAGEAQTSHREELAIKPERKPRQEPAAEPSSSDRDHLGEVSPEHLATEQLIQRSEILVELLRRLGAIDAADTLTEMGLRLARIRKQITDLVA